MSVATINNNNIEQIWSLVNEGKLETAVLEGTTVTLVAECYYTENEKGEEFNNLRLYGRTYDEVGEVEEVFFQEELLDKATVTL